MRWLRKMVEIEGCFSWGGIGVQVRLVLAYPHNSRPCSTSVHNRKTVGKDLVAVHTDKNGKITTTPLG